jgi:6-phosphogluconolactonase (cycloisomerase 2 family)
MLFYSGSDSSDGTRSDVILWREDTDGLGRVGSIALRSPSWLQPHPRLPILYATQESDPGGVVVVDVGPDGSLRERQRVDSHGGFPCHLAVDALGQRLVVSNYGDGVVAAWPLAPDGTLAEPSRVWQLTGTGPVADRQERAHAHMARLDDETILVADLGSDALVGLGPAGETNVELSLAPGFGPRHFVTLGDDRAVLVGELSAELALIELGPRPRVLDVVPTTELDGALPSGITRRGPDVIVANRRVGTIAAFTVEGDRLVRGEEIRLPGDNPRAIASDGSRLFVCLQDAGLVATYTPGDEDGPRLTPAAHVSDFGVVPWSLGEAVPDMPTRTDPDPIAR